MTKTWEHDFAVERMREDPTISYRALAKVLGLSDQTVRRWRDEEGIPPRSHHNTGRRRNRTRSAPWPGKAVWSIPVPTRDQDDDEYDDGDDDDQPETEFQSDDSPPSSRAASLAQTWETIGQMTEKLGPLPLWPGLKAPSTPRGARRSRTAVATTLEDPKARLRAITAEVDNRKPRGQEAVELLAEAAPYLAGGVTALAQYGEARGCAPEDIAAAERAVVGKGRR